MIASPCANLIAVVSDVGLVSLHFAQGDITPTPPLDHPHLTRLRQELASYFAGTLRAFTVPIASAAGTPFQHACWNYLRTIPYGTTRSYGEQARALGNPAAVRAVGQANGRNPVAILVPCHRVIGSNGTLTGFAGGIDRKRWMLEHEQAVTGAFLVPPHCGRGLGRG